MTALTIPPVGPPIETPLPPSSSVTLDNGLRVVAIRRTAVPLVELRLRVPFAAAPPATAAVLADTLLTGTERRSRAEIAIALQLMGGGLSASADPDQLAVGGSSLSRDLGVLLDLLAELLQGATYPADEVEGERGRLTERVAVARSLPARIARDALLARRYGDHPYAFELPDAEQVGAVEPDAVRALHAERVAATESVLVLVGDLDPDAALADVQTALGGWGPAAEPVPGVPPLPPTPPVPALLVDRPGAVQTTIRMGGTAPSRSDPTYAAAKLANLVFGGYFSSRLVANIRERRGYTYSPRSSIEHGAAGSMLSVASDVATEVTAPALMEITYELARTASLPVEPEELEAARRYAVGSLALSTATGAGLASTLSALLAAGLDLDYLRDHPRALAAVTADDVLAAARPLLGPANLVTVLVGDAERTAAEVAALGAVERA